MSWSKRDWSFCLILVVVTVLAYQTGAGLTELLTPTNGGLMAVLLAAGVPYSSWIKFAIVGVLLALCVGIVGMISGV